MGGKSGGGYSAGPMLEYGDKALDIQREVYDQTRSDAQPWYNAGSSAVNQLMALMGLGGPSQSREQVYNNLLPQYTSQSQGSGGMFVDQQGRVVDLSKEDYMNSPLAADGYTGTSGAGMLAELEKARKSGDYSVFQNYGYTPLQSNNQQIDYSGLNSAVDAAMGQQGQTPDNFGQLARAFSMEDYQADPGYQFRLDQGNKALERQMAASGQNFTPAALKALNEYNSGMASQEYGQAYDRYNIDQNNLFNRLAALSGMGQTATAQTSGAGQNYGNQAGNIYGQMGNAVTSAQVANASRPSMFGNLLNTGLQIGAATYGGPGWTFSDINVKENIVRTGSQNGYPIYSFSYKATPGKTYSGVMAQDVEKIKPEAVITHDGVKMVNYDMIGVEMREIN